MKKRIVKLLGVSVLILVIIVGALFYKAEQHHKEVINSKTIPSSSPNKSTAKPVTNNNTTDGNTSSTNSTPGTSSPNSSIVSTPPGPAVVLSSAPSGTFVSNHSPNLSGNPRPSQEQSTCNTQPGASCYIEFTSSSGQVKTLPSETADSNGTVIWNWDVNQAGFTTGEWQIKAVASLGGVTKSTTSDLKLNVQP